MLINIYIAIYNHPLTRSRTQRYKNGNEEEEEEEEDEEKKKSTTNK